ncbi:MAG: helix-turn-helix domain-containing protein [Candidatus Cryptobacteroides sp.]
MDSDFNLDNLPKQGLKKVNREEIARIGQFFNHEKSGFFLCEQGSMILADKTHYYNIRQGDIYIYPSFTRLYINYISDDIRGVVGFTDTNFIVKSALTFIDESNSIYVLKYPCISLTEEEQDRIREIFEILYDREQDEPSVLNERLRLALGEALCYQIAIAYGKHWAKQPREASRDDKIFLKFIFSIYENLREEKEVKFYAAQQSLTPRYFSLKIKSHTGKNAAQWISEAVINECKTLLTDSSLSIKEIAYRLGFTNQSFFGRYFKKHTGLTPGEFRKSLSQQV